MRSPSPSFQTPTAPRPEPEPTLWQSLIPVGFLILLLGVNVVLFEGSPHIPLLLSAACASLVAIAIGHSWQDIEEGIVQGILVSLRACIILLVIGILVGTWIAGGIVPLMIYFGLKIMTPVVFLPLACLVCAMVSLATGSSWSTAGTVGIALIGIAHGLGIPMGVAAGAIVSGSYFGDKMSPLSDTTNLAPAVSGSELFEHIRHMVYTTVPALVLSLVIYTVMGFFYETQAASGAEIDLIQQTLREHFNLHPLLVIPPLLVIAMVVFRIPALPALLAGAILGGVCAWGFQGTGIGEIFAVSQTGYRSETGVAAVDTLLTRGGLESMLWTLSLIMCAMCFGGAMERSGMLQKIAHAILRLANSTGSLILSVIGTCITMNIIAPDQYLSIVVPGRMYKAAFEQHRLHPKNLSRSLEDGGTLSSALVPWNTCGAYMASTLGVATVAYAPYAFLNLLTPIIGVFLGFMGWSIVRLKESD